MSFANIFSQSVDCHFFLLTLSSREQNLVIIIKCSFSVLSYMDHDFSAVSKKSLTYSVSFRCSPVLSSRSSIVLHFIFRFVIHLDLVFINSRRSEGRGRRRADEQSVETVSGGQGRRAVPGQGDICRMSGHRILLQEGNRQVLRQGANRKQELHGRKAKQDATWPTGAEAGFPHGGSERKQAQPCAPRDIHAPHG